MKTKTHDRMGWVRIGSVGVDSGQLMIGDPCYIKPGWDDDAKDISQNDSDGPFTFDYNGACNATLSYNYVGELDHGTAVAFSTAYGDGEYPVYAYYPQKGRAPTQVLVATDEPDKFSPIYRLWQEEYAEPFDDYLPEEDDNES